MVEVTENWGGVEGASLYTFESGSGKLQAKVTNYGAALVSLRLRDAAGTRHETTLGYDTLQEWQAGGNYFGCTVGRYGNRIAAGKFTLNGTEHTLAHTNNGANHLHGGEGGYDKRLWDATVVDEKDTGVRGVRLTLVSPDGDNGYPGELHIVAWILVDSNDELLLKWQAALKEGSATHTICNLTNHTYWNLGSWLSHAPRNVLDHKLTCAADSYVEVDAEAIPTGRLPSVKGTVFDFTRGRVLGEGVDDALVAPVKGYDHTLCFPDDVGPPQQPEALAGGWSKVLPCMATLECEATGLGFWLYTSEPGVQLYTGNYLDGEKEKGFGGTQIAHRGGVCLECQHFPDSPNRPNFPSTSLAPGEVYNHTTVHKFFTA
eukprot:Rhum_TRINITY_DN9702_c0_g1::Rhum_TRINITY_DN9702_c0_g1_i1::g.34801::m.34801/K01785/galM, GALM; aldose 1-epimerase